MQSSKDTKTHSNSGKRKLNDEEAAVAETAQRTKRERTGEETSISGRERLKRHWMDVAGRVWIPEMWEQEGLLKEWIDCTAFEKSLASSSRIMSARAALVEEGRQAAAANPTRLMRFENGCYR